MKDAVAVALVTFAVLLPNVQTMLTSKIEIMKTPTNATLLNAIIIAVAFYMLKEHVVGMLLKTSVKRVDGRTSSSIDFWCFRNQLFQH